MAIPELLTKPSTLIVLALVVAGIAVFFFPDIKVPDWYAELSGRASKSADDVTLPAMAQPPSTDVVALNAEPVFPPVSTSSAPRMTGEAATSPAVAVTPPVEAPVVKASTPVAPVVVASPPLVAASRPVFAASFPAVAASRAQSAPVLPSTGTVVFKAKGSTWVKVVDAKGIVQLSKTILDGEVVGASGTTPLSVVIGRVDATEVEVRGKPFGLTGVSKDNVARFEVK